MEPEVTNAATEVTGRNEIGAALREITETLQEVAPKVLDAVEQAARSVTEADPAELLGTPAEDMIIAEPVGGETGTDAGAYADADVIFAEATEADILSHDPAHVVQAVDASAYEADEIVATQSDAPAAAAEAGTDAYGNEECATTD